MDKAKNEKVNTKINKIRPFDLSPYVVADNNINKKCIHCTDSSPDTLENGIKEVRVQVMTGYKLLLNEKERIGQFFNTGIEHTRFISNYLKEPSNSLPRAGAIALGAASGYIIGLRHGVIRRLLYTTISGSAVASFCYPKEAENIAQQGITEAKQLAKIGYNFVYGVKPGDEVALPKLPENVSNFIDSFSSVIKSTINMFKSSSDDK